MSIKTHHGEIRRVTGYSYVWEIPDIIDITKQFRHIFSPRFLCEGRCWWLKSSIDGGFTYFCLIRNFTDGDNNPCTVSYRLFILDDSGEDYWTTPLLTGTFSFTGKIGQVQTLPAHVLETDNGRITPGGALSLHVTFSPSSDESSSHISDVVKEICSDFQPKESCACSSGGINELMKNFKDLFLSERNTDVNLDVKGRVFKAHKLILMSRSPVFDKMFENDMVEHKTGHVHITDCDPDMFHTFLLFLYCGKAEISTINNAVDLYYIADKYIVKGLSQYCIKFLLNNLTVESFGDIIAISQQHRELELLSSTNTFFAANVKQIIATEYWKTFNRDNPDEANELLIKALSQS